MLFIESKRDFILIKTKHKEVNTYQAITYMKERLPGDEFVRVHRSFIVNLKKIESWNQDEIEVAGLTIPIGRTCKREALKKLEKQTKVL